MTELNTNISSDEGFINKLDGIIEANLQNEQFGVEELSDEIGLSRSQVHRKLKILTGKSVSQFIREFRLARALELIKSDYGTASEVAYKVGFNSPSYFNKCFQELYGFSPGEAKDIPNQKIDVLREKVSLKTNEESTFGPYSKRSAIVVILLIASIAAFFYFKDRLTKLEQNEELVENFSLAVIPFKNLSDEQNSVYFSDGMMDAILTDLANLGAFKVISRTSVEQYRNTEKTIPQIAGELNVTHILEGSVQRDNDQVRIIVQLIKADEDGHLWAKTYDRDLKNVFALQSEISSLIASELQSEIAPERYSSINTKPTENIQAYDFHLRAKKYQNDFFYNQDPADADLANQYAKKAIRLDQNFNWPRITLGWNFIDQVRFLGRNRNLYDSAQLLAEEVLTDNPDDYEAMTMLSTVYRLKGIRKIEAKKILIDVVANYPNYTIAMDLLGWYYASEESRYDLSLRLYERASELAPFNSLYQSFQGSNWRELKQYELSEKFLKQAINLHADFVGAYINMAVLFVHWNGDYDKAIGFLEKANEYNPDNFGIKHQLGQFHSWNGNFEKSNAFYEELRKIVEGDRFELNSSIPWYPHRYAYTLWNLDRKEEAMKYFEQEIESNKSNIVDGNQVKGLDSFYDLAAVYSFLGNKAEAEKYLQKMASSGSWGPPDYLLKDPLFNPMLDNGVLKTVVKKQNEKIKTQLDSYNSYKEMSFQDFVELILLVQDN